MQVLFTYKGINRSRPYFAFTASPNFYAWTEVKKYYLRKLKTIGANPSGNMLNYLKTLK